MRTIARVTRIKLQKGRHLVKRGDVWYLETCTRGWQRRRSLGTGDLEVATRRATDGTEPWVAPAKPHPELGRVRVLSAPGREIPGLSGVDIYGKGRSGSRGPRSLLPLQPSTFLILLAIGRGQAHGYAIMQEIGQLGGGQLRMGPGTLYRSVQRMLVDKLLEEVDGEASEDSDQRRRYYRLTKLGLSVAREESLRLERLVMAAKVRGLTPK